MLEINMLHHGYQEMCHTVFHNFGDDWDTSRISRPKQACSPSLSLEASPIDISMMSVTSAVVTREECHHRVIFSDGIASLSHSVEHNFHLSSHQHKNLLSEGRWVMQPTQFPRMN
uniref:Uncharacterized protein n=1 Tax=Trichobilharzia regenti TaxID=157069 RepID=A0AA85KCU1_TRIRE|nr:unnamed protein product [Trichobilharzia regenti]